MQLFNNIYHNRRVLITGHTGFKGSWLYTILQKMGAEVNGLSLTPPTKPSHFEICGYSLPDGPCDVRNHVQVEKKILAFQPEIIFHMASQPLVINSYLNPRDTFEINIMGNISLLEAARKTNSLRAIVNITSDKVYDPFVEKVKYTETDRLGGIDPYSSSKACVEIILNSYIQSYFNIKNYNKEHRVLAGIPRAGNVIGGGDWAMSRIIPDIARAIHLNSPLSIRNPLSVRPWQHVLDCLSGYLLLGQHLLEEDAERAGIYNFGPVDDKLCTVSDIVQIALEFWPALKIETDNSLHPYETKAIRLDCTKAKKELKWEPVWDSKQAIRKSFTWYYDYLSTGKVNTMDDIDQYISDASQKCVWVKE